MVYNYALKIYIWIISFPFLNYIKEWVAKENKETGGGAAHRYWQTDWLKEPRAR